VKVSGSEKQHVVKYGDVLFTGSSEISEEAGMSSVVAEDFEGPVYLNSFSFGVRFNQDIPISPGFAKHLFRSGFMRLEIAKTASGVTRFNVSKERFRKIKVPIICPENPKKSLEIQSEIVRILDSFTERTTDLTTELTTRKKQYNYYRDQLLSFEEVEVEWRSLDEITISIASGRNKTRSTEGVIPVYGSTGLIGFTKEAAYSGNVLLVARVGANAGRVNAVSGDFDVSDNTLIVRPNEAWNVRFAFHQLTHMNLNQYAVGGGQPLVTGGLLKSLKVPCPPINEQERIASVLDKFDALTNSLTEGLPREIELRQKQYAHYRDVLLSFPKPQEVVA
jgi:type I restriction enzyme S subunit